jgi:hypothetical protein
MTRMRTKTIATAALIIGTAIVGGCGETPASDLAKTSSPSASAVPTPTVKVLPTVKALASPSLALGVATADPAWALVRIAEPEVSGLNAIYAIDGMAYVLGETDRPAMWRSADGSSWSAVTGIGGPGDFGTHLLDLAHGPTTYVAVGCVGGDPCSSSIVWRSVDGVAWRKSAVQLGYEGATFYGIEFHDGRFLAIGQVCASGASGQVPTNVELVSAKAIRTLEPGRSSAANKPCARLRIGGQPFLWQSVDGRVWRAGPALPEGGVIENLMADDGSLYGIGRDDAAKPVTWRLGAHDEWELMARIPNAERPIRVRRISDGFIALAPQVLRSSDGQDWSEDPSQPHVSAGGAGGDVALWTTLSGVVHAGDSQVVIVGGWQGEGPDPDDPQDLSGAAAWFSTGGAAWSRVGDGPGFEHAMMVDGVNLGGRLIAIGFDGVVWTHPLPFP